MFILLIISLDLSKIVIIEHFLVWAFAMFCGEKKVGKYPKKWVTKQKSGFFFGTGFEIV